MKITIQEQEYEVKSTMRAMLLFEDMTQKAFGVKTLNDQVMYLLCCINANNEKKLTKDELLDAMDEDTTIFSTFVSLLIGETTEATEEDDKKKGQ